MADFSKDKLISSMLQPKRGGGPNGPIIQEIGAVNGDDGKKDTDTDAVIELNDAGEFELSSPKKQAAAEQRAAAPAPAPAAVPEPEGPSLFDEMMAAQAAAKKEKEKVAAKATNKSFGTGFKKGFFGGGSGGTKTKATTGTSTKKKESEIINVKAAPGGAKKSVSHSLNNISKEVNEAMAESTNPAVKELQKGEWMTPDLMQIFATNPIISRGLRNPRCQKAMEMMQKDPEGAKKQFLGDTEVDEFMKEFGRVMGAHFDKLGDKQEQSQASNLGPLADAAIKREQERAAKTKSNPGIQPYDEKAAAEEKKVKDIVNNPELAQLLMDPKMQGILQDCGNPKKFQEHMKNPETARKIKLLFDAGLVKSE